MDSGDVFCFAKTVFIQCADRRTSFEKRISSGESDIACRRANITAESTVASTFNRLFIQSPRGILSAFFLYTS